MREAYRFFGNEPSKLRHMTPKEQCLWEIYQHCYRKLTKPKHLQKQFNRRMETSLKDWGKISSPLAHTLEIKTKILLQTLGN